METISSTRLMMLKCKSFFDHRQADGLYFSQGDYFIIPNLSLSTFGFSYEFYLKQPSLPGVYQTVLSSPDSNSSLQVLASINDSKVWVSMNAGLEASVNEDYSKMIIKILAQWVHHGLSFIRNGLLDTVIVIYINGVVKASKSIESVIPAITQIMVGGSDF